MNSKSFRDGWDAFLKNYSGYSGSSRDQSYIETIAKEIEKAEKNLNTVVKNYRSSDASKGGFFAEEWHAGTYNINAAVKGSDSRAWVPKRTGGISNTFAQPDISTTEGQAYSLKYMNNAKVSAREQAIPYWQKYNEYSKFNDVTYEEYLRARGIDPASVKKFDSIYHDQFRLVPADHMERATDALIKRISDYKYRGLDTSGLEETLSHLTDRVIGIDGVESIPLTKQDSMNLAKLAAKGELDLGELGVTVIDLVGYEYIFTEALNAGINAAIISIALEIGPALCQTIMQRDFSIERIKELGHMTLSSGGFAFVNGAISAGLMTAFKMGVFGERLINANPSIVGGLTSIAVDVIFKTCLLIAGKKTKSEYVFEIIKDTGVICSATGFGFLFQMLLPEFGPIPFILGSLVGSMLGSFAIDKAHKALLSLCWKHNLTLFGLVKLDYQIPETILRNIGIKGFDIDSFEVQTFDIEQFSIDSFDINTFEPKSFEIGIGIKMVSHSVIEAYRVGYTFE